MRKLWLLALPLVAAGFARWDAAPPVDNIHRAILRRFGEFQTFGMSRLVRPASLGKHFRPAPGAARDFLPETPDEKALLEQAESQGWQVGFYLAGRAILDGAHHRTVFNFRELKGPAILTGGTPRSLPAWDAVYPFAQSAVRELAAGGQPAPSAIDGWTLAALPVGAFKQECLQCHPGSSSGSLLGAAIYVYRRAP
ncbi:MAG: hypothetical protein R2729_25930 [Bryobacteraceae bacterium]